MTHTSRMEALRRRVRTLLTDHGAAAGATVRESILIRQGAYCGRRFTCDGLAAVWFDEEAELKVHGRDGAVIEVLHDPLGRGEPSETTLAFPVRSGDAPAAPIRRAA